MRIEGSLVLAVAAVAALSGCGPEEKAPDGPRVRYRVTEGGVERADVEPATRDEVALATDDGAAAAPAPARHRDDDVMIPADDAPATPAAAPATGTVATAPEPPAAPPTTELPGRSSLLYEHGSAPVALAFSPGGTSIVTGAADGNVRLFDTASQVVQRKRAQGWLTAVDFSPEGDRYLAADRFGLIRVYEVATGEPVASLTAYPGLERYGAPERPTAVRAARFLPDAGWVVSAGDDRAVRLWEIATRKEIKLGEHRSRVFALSVSRDGSLVATGGDDPEIHVYATTTGELLRRLEVSSLRRTTALTFSPLGGIVVAGTDAGELRVFELTAGREIAKLETLGMAKVHSLAFSRDGSRLAAGVTLRSGALSGKKAAKPRATPTGSEPSAELSEVTPDPDLGVLVWTWPNLQEPRLHVLMRGAAPEDAVHGVAFAPDGTKLYAASTAYDQLIVLDAEK